ncbi:MAG: acyl-CoA dehydrogenase family protein [Candidatus Microthrix subdominans]
MSDASTESTDMPTKSSRRDHPELRDEVSSWVTSNWDPELSVGEWWTKLRDARWSVPAWPSEWYGRDLSRGEAVVVAEEIAKAGAIGPPGGLGLLLAGPTIIAQGTDEQKQRYIPTIVDGSEAWCQLFSEPEAGSDLAAIRTSAVRDGDEWIINGQKVWTSAGQIADLGMLMARTDPTVPKHSGISYFAIDMHQPGIEVRPLKEMTGRALFNEVFISDARVADEALIGGEGRGWAVANTTLMFERAGLGAGGTGAVSSAVPGTVHGHLEKRVGDFVRGDTSGSGSAMAGGGPSAILKMAATTGAALHDPVLRDDLMRLHTLVELAKMTNRRAKAAKAIGIEIPGLPNLSKLMMSDMMRATIDLGPRILGPAGQLAGDSAPYDGAITEMVLFAPGPAIYGGTDQIQRNIIGERVLGLPSEPRNDKTLPFNELRTSKGAE